MFIFWFWGYKICFLTLLYRGKMQMEIAWFKESVGHQLMSLKNI